MPFVNAETAHSQVDLPPSFTAKHTSAKKVPKHYIVSSCAIHS